MSDTATPAAALPEKLEGSLYLRIPISRLIALSIVTCSLYEAYWIYKNWQYLKIRRGDEIMPFWRGFFGVFFCHSLLHEIHDDDALNAVAEPSFAAGTLATFWVVLTIFGNLLGRFVDDPAIFFVLPFIPSFLFLAPVQAYVNKVEAVRNPGGRWHSWTAGHIFCLVVGILIWLLAIAGFFVSRSPA